ncbi:glutathione S-transferase family protein [Novosphingobium album (ex Liu et al. 2023)]|uniref:Glutathione S-transferase family protein n=1 Tax=Novosphingobium album (ex Liu et al. 2023) TaxID=3031130 RepID=A0ABT5WPJ6_9SPHN|nr:glutathione S-transferase family protein [Novosphingobium album (ex Liu et al. 2023)]MDE8651967.1 glutathione S-transferase family protein [Novosphingobium album (ex Liu et al. 2023)]
MPIDPDATIEITAFDWVPPFAQGFVRDLRPRWACEELGLAYRERLISAVQRPEWYFGDQPWGQVPHLRDGDIAIFESGATLIHLGEKGARLLPSSGQGRASVLSWLLAALNSIEPSVFELSNVDIFSRKEEWAALRRPSLIAMLGQRLDRLAAALGQGDWLAGSFSIADIAMATVLREAAKGGLLDERPTLAAYLERCTARPAFQTALAAQLAPFATHAPPAPAGV